LRFTCFHLLDPVFLLALRYPVRCRDCGYRFHVRIFDIPMIKREIQRRRAKEMSQKPSPPAQASH
jgi:hypothetical protein